MKQVKGIVDLHVRKKERKVRSQGQQQPKNVVQRAADEIVQFVSEGAEEEGFDLHTYEIEYELITEILDKYLPDLELEVEAELRKRGFKVEK